MGSLAELAATFAPRGGGGDFWSPDKDAKRFRLYRVYQDGKPTLVGYTEEKVWTGHAYEDDSPEIAKTRDMLYASGTKEDKAKARALQPRTKAWLVGVLPDNPTGFVIWKAPSSVVQRVLVLLATAGNDGLPVGYPKGPDGKFLELVEKGAGSVCGPSGRDFGVRCDKTAPPASMYDVALLERTPSTKTLAFNEEESPDPAKVAVRINEAIARKKGG